MASSGGQTGIQKTDDEILAECGITDVELAPGVKLWMPKGAGGEVAFVFAGTDRLHLGSENLSPYVGKIHTIIDALREKGVEVRMNETPFFKNDLTDKGVPISKQTTFEEAVAEPDQAIFIGPLVFHLVDPEGRLKPGSIERLLPSGE